MPFPGRFRKSLTHTPWKMRLRSRTACPGREILYCFHRPSCQFDLFRNYEDRGDQFKEAVRKNCKQDHEREEKHTVKRGYVPVALIIIFHCFR